MNANTTCRNIKRLGKSSSKKREGLGTVDVNRRVQQQQQQQQQPKVEAKRRLAGPPGGLYSAEELVSIRSNLSANLTLAKRRMMARLSQSSAPKDVQMYRYLTDSSKKRRPSKRQQTTTTGGKLKQHRPRPLEAPRATERAASPPVAAAAPPAVGLDILFGSEAETTDVDPPSLCDPSSSPLMPACAREPEQGDMWEMSNHAAGLLSRLLCDEKEHIISGEPIDLWAGGAAAMSDLEMAGKALKRGGASG